jgi:type III pantothenate kinase
MLLACDIGNTFVKFAVYDNDNSAGFFKTTHDNFSPEVFKNFGINKAAVCSVVPAAEQKLISFIKEYFGITPYQVKINSPFSVKVNYQTPGSLGTDRLCSAEGAYTLFRKDPLYQNYNEEVFLVTIDSGTATTINIVRYNAEFTGGLIAPGINTMINSLNRGTAQLPEINIVKDYKNFIGNDTNSCIASGILNSTTGLIEKTITYLKEQHNARIIKLYITGGNGKIISENLAYENVYVEDLVLLGVKSVFERWNYVH